MRDGDAVAAIAPFYAIPWVPGLWTWSLMGTDTTSRIEPIADPEHLEDAGVAIATALAQADPSPARVRLEGLPSDSPWPELLRTRGPGRPVRLAAHRARHAGADHRAGGRDRRRLAVRAQLQLPPADAPLAPQARQGWRRVPRRRRRPRRSTPRSPTSCSGPTTRAGTGAGGSTALDARHRRRCSPRRGARLLLYDRFQLVSLKLDGKTINSQLFVVAGGEISYWNGGFDEDFANYKPSLLALVEASARASSTATRASTRTRLSGIPVPIRRLRGQPPLDDADSTREALPGGPRRSRPSRRATRSPRG